MTPSRIVIIGVGNVGMNLARYFHLRGFQVRALIDKTPENIRTLATALDAIAGSSPREIPEDAEWLCLCVPDQQIVPVASELVSSWQWSKGILVSHSSGFRTSLDLSDLAVHTECYGSFHPIQSFPETNIGLGRLDALGCGIEGTKPFMKGAHDVCAKLRWRAIAIPQDRKALYHAACVFLGNFLPVLTSQAHDILARISEEADLAHFFPMIHHVLQRSMSQPLHSTLTGPAARGDLSITGEQEEMLGSLDPALGSTYRHFTEVILRTLERTARNP